MSTAARRAARADPQVRNPISGYPGGSSHLRIVAETQERWAEALATPAPSRGPASDPQHERRAVRVEDYRPGAANAAPAPSATPVTVATRDARAEQHRRGGGAAGGVGIGGHEGRCSEGQSVVALPNVPPVTGQVAHHWGRHPATEGPAAARGPKRVRAPSPVAPSTWWSCPRTHVDVDADPRVFAASCVPRVTVGTDVGPPTSSGRGSPSRH
jgi:hypothetical protein